MSGVARAVRSAAGLALAVAGTELTRRPTRYGWGHRAGVVHAVSFRALGGMLAAGGAGAAAAAGRSARRAGRPIGTAVADALLAIGTGVAVGNLAVVSRQGWAGRSTAGRPVGGHGSTAADPAGSRADVVVLLLNTLMGAADAAEIAARAIAVDATVLALPECPERLARAIAAELAAHGRDVQAFGTRENAWPTAETWLLVDRRSGHYRQVDAPSMQLGAVIAEPIDHDGPTLAAVHPPAPMGLVGLPAWRRYVKVAVDVARTRPDAIVAGDFNTTLDHEPMADLTPYVDAATVVGRGAEGTWPARLPALLATPIDHVLIRPDRWSVLGTRTYRVGASDHRAVVAQLARR